MEKGKEDEGYTAQKAAEQEPPIELIAFFAGVIVTIALAAIFYWGFCTGYDQGWYEGYKGETHNQHFLTRGIRG